MRYKVTDNSFIEENHIVPFTVNWKTSLVHLLIWSPGLYFLYYTCFISSWDIYENGVAVGVTASSILAIVFMTFALVCSGAYTAVTKKFPISLKKTQRYSVSYFYKKHLDIPIYKEAYQECLSEIKTGTFDNYEWQEIFHKLSSEAVRLKEGEKKIKKINIPKRDFAGELKDSNDMYLKGLK